MTERKKYTKINKKIKNLRKNQKSTQESMKKSRIYTIIKNDFCSRTVWRRVVNPPLPTVAGKTGLT